MLAAAAAGRSRLARAGLLVALAALPWIWFPARDAAGYPGDVLAILLPALVNILVAAAVVLTVRRRQRRWLLPAGSLVVMGLVAVLGPWLPADAGPVRPDAAVTVLGANVMERPTPAAALVAAAPDVLVVSEWVRWVDPALAAAFPHRELLADGPQIGVYSRLPMRVLERAGPDLPGLRIEVDGPAGPFVLYALHAPRPWYTASGSYQATLAEHHRIMQVLAARTRAERLPVVVVGDLNSPDRGRDYRTLLRTGNLVDAMLDRSTRYTSVGKWTPLLLRIDHVLVSGGWCGDGATQLELPGSDHRGVAATVGPCAGAATP